MIQSRIIRNILFVTVSTLLWSTGWSQIVPNWYSEDNRNVNYPESLYYSGLGYAEVSGSSPLETSIKKAEQNAKAEALSKILTTVKSKTVSSSMSVEMSIENGVDEQYIEQFSSLTQIDVAFKDVPGLQCQHYKNGSTIIAFAYVKRVDLAQYYNSKINATLTQIKTTLDNTDKLIRMGEKIKARSTAQTAIQQIAELENSQRILLAVSNNADIQSNITSVLVKRLVSVLSELKNSTAIYIDSQAMLQGKPYPSLIDDIKGSLSKIGVNFVNKKDLADWVIIIRSDVVQENNLSGQYFVWIDGDISVFKKATNQVVYSGTLSSLKENHPNGIKGGHSTSSYTAAKVAYKETSHIISEKLSELITN